MKKLLLVMLALVVAVCVCACSGAKPSADPLVAKWVRVFNDGQSKVLFSFEAVGDLDVVVWHTGASGELEQAEDHAGSYAVDKEGSTITYELDGESYVFGYSLEEKTSLTITYGDTVLELNYVESNSAAK